TVKAAALPAAIKSMPGIPPTTRDASIEDEVRFCQNRLARKGWALVAAYSNAATRASRFLVV
ncbi:MAG TPA: hypothetical protein VKE94_22310, partial [Gemmataceae bacterium]|nr:hypothetical protein [Gemmataceae bacterium]